MLKTAFLVSGGGTNLQAVIDAVENGKVTNTELTLVIANKKSAYALERAKQHGIPTAVVTRMDYGDAFEDKLIALLETNHIDLIVLAGFLSVLSPAFIKRFEHKIINVHPSLIPAFCGKGFYGLKVHEAALEKGVKVTGATVHYVNEEVDGGAIIAQKAVEVLDGDTPETLQKRVMEQAEQIVLPQAIHKIANTKQ